MPMIERKHFGKSMAWALVICALLAGCAFSTAQTKNPAMNAGTKQSRKMEKQQQKAMKKYMKAQKKAQRKMEKLDRKNTHDPYRPK
jgi:ABC-type uncharacterized transport system auxiliary subunit